MNDKAGGNRGLWDAGALAVAAVVTVLATVWGGGSAPSAASTPVASTQETLAQHIALRACQLLLPRRAGVMAVMAAVTVLTTGCVVHVHFGSSAAPSAQPPYRAELAYAQCMRTHGLPGFPDPSPSGSVSWQLTGNPGSPAARANDICKHLLAGGSTGPGTASP